jgi:hypothetical protein
LPEAKDGNDFSITEAAKHLGVPAVALQRWLGYSRRIHTVSLAEIHRVRKSMRNLFLPLAGLELHEKLPKLDDQMLTRHFGAYPFEEVRTTEWACHEALLSLAEFVTLHVSYSDACCLRLQAGVDGPTQHSSGLLFSVFADCGSNRANIAEMYYEHLSRRGTHRAKLAKDNEQICGGLLIHGTP